MIAVHAMASAHEYAALSRLGRCSTDVRPSTSHTYVQVRTQLHSAILLRVPLHRRTRKYATHVRQVRTQLHSAILFRVPRHGCTRKYVAYVRPSTCIVLLRALLYRRTIMYATYVRTSTCAALLRAPPSSGVDQDCRTGLLDPTLPRIHVCIAPAP